MIWLAVGGASLLCMLAICQALIVAAYLYRFVTFSPPKAGSYEPKAAVILAVRGPDPFLDATLSGLVQQEYPDYTVFVVVDSDNDPVWQQLQTFESQPGAERVVTQVVREPQMTCSLKCGALAQAVSDLDPSFEVVAFIDGDAPPHKTWLRELVAPLKDPAIGATTGNRWYAPRDGQWGSLVRYCWNAGAIVQVWLNGILWAGSMALRAEVLGDAEVAQNWLTSLSVDGTVCRQMKRKGYRVQFVPSVMMINEEAIELGAFMRWVERQLVAARSADSGWLIIGVHALNLIGSQVLLLTTMICGWLAADLLMTSVSAIALAAYWVSSVSCVLMLERVIGKVTGKPFRWLNLRTFSRWLPAMLLTHVVYPMTMASATFKKRVSWRGVEYDVRGRQDIRLVEYRPFEAKADGKLSESVI